MAMAKPTSKNQPTPPKAMVDQDGSAEPHSMIRQQAASSSPMPIPARRQRCALGPPGMIRVVLDTSPLVSALLVDAGRPTPSLRRRPPS